MKYEENSIGEVLITKVLDPRIAADVASGFKADLIEYVKRGRRKIVLDLSAVTFIDSSGLGALIATLKFMGKDGEIALAAAAPTVAVMFELTRMDRVFRMFSSSNEAVSALS